MQRTPNYPVLTFVACALVVFAFGERLIHPFTPKGVSNALSKQSAEFLKQGGFEQIKWRLPNSDAFAAARREEKPILVLIGAPWSAAGRHLDQLVLSTERSQRLLDRNFICIRIDSEQNPDWAGAFLPITRAAQKYLPDLQIYVLDSEGRLIAPLLGSGFAEIPTESEFIAAVSDALSRFEQIQRQVASGAVGSGNLPLPGASQARDLEALSQGTPDSTPDFKSARLALEIAAAPEGGYPVRGNQPLWPQAWMFQLAADGPEALAPTMTHLLPSPICDPMDGGFYHGAIRSNWSQIVFDKVSTQNAEMALLMARLYVATGDAKYYNLATQTLDLLFRPLSENGMQDTTGFVEACRIGDEQPPRERSLRSSFSPQRLRALFPGGMGWDLLAQTLALKIAINPQWEVVRDGLTLSVDQNPQMAPAMRDPDNYTSVPPDLQEALKKMRQSSAPAVTTTQFTMATEGVVAARAIEAARILGDQDRLSKATTLFEKLSVLTTGSDVLHGLLDTVNTQPNLADYLAYSDAAIQDFLNLGRLPSLESGFLVLQRAKVLFAGDQPGYFKQASNKSSHASVPSSNGPALADDCSESTSAQMMRLTWMYGQLFSHSPDRNERLAAAEMLSVARAIESNGSGPASVMGAYAGGYFLDSALITDGQIVYAVGSNPSAQAAALATHAPFRMIAPAVGPIRPDLQSRPGGYYITIGEKTAGPFTLPAIQKLLVPQLVIGPS